jgi:replication-associated recombination protein RarA
MTLKQADLAGKLLKEYGQEDDDREDLAILKSTLQKAIRRADIEKAMYFALRLAEKNWWTAWRRLGIIADEDVGQPDAIVAVDTLYRKFMALRKDGKEKLTWDMQRCVVCAAKILADSAKDRRSDEFLEILQAFEKYPDNEYLKKLREDFEKIPDEALDMHTIQGRRLGRANSFWYEVSSETVNKTEAYEKWHRWFKPLLVQLTKEKKVKA